MKQKYVHKRGERYVYRRQVPSEVAHLDTRREIKLSLKTKDLSIALRKAEIYNAEIEEFWVGLVMAGNAAGLQEKYAAAVRLAKARGFAYKTVEQVAQAPLGEFLARLEAANGEKIEDALLGAVEVPKVLLSACIDEYWGLAADQIIGKSEHAISKWKNPRLAAMNNFITEIGDKAIAELVRADVLKFREWCNEKIKAGWSPGTANKQMRYVKDMIRTVALAKNIEIDVDALFKKVSFDEPEVSRPPFEAKYVQEKLLPGLDDLLDDARLVFWALADTGARPSEIVRLLPEDIILNDEIPHIWIRRELKTKTSERKIPLVGYALKAFRAKPQGFNDRWKSADSVSNIVNRFLTDNQLLPTEDHSLYSLRHTFKDRLRDAEAPEEIIDDLMGHKKSGPKYGRGHRLDKKLKWLEMIAYKVASSTTHEIK